MTRMGTRDLLLIAFGVLLVIAGFGSIFFTPRTFPIRFAAVCAVAAGGLCIGKGIYE